MHISDAGGQTFTHRTGTSWLWHITVNYYYRCCFCCLQLCLRNLFQRLFQVRPGLTQVSKRNLWKLVNQDILQTRCPSSIVKVGKTEGQHIVIVHEILFKFCQKTKITKKICYEDFPYYSIKSVCLSLSLSLFVVCLFVQMTLVISSSVTVFYWQ